MAWTTSRATAAGLATSDGPGSSRPELMNVDARHVSRSPSPGRPPSVPWAESSVGAAAPRQDSGLQRSRQGNPGSAQAHPVPQHQGPDRLLWRCPLTIPLCGHPLARAKMLLVHEHPDWNSAAIARAVASADRTVRRWRGRSRRADSAGSAPARWTTLFPSSGTGTATALASTLPRILESRSLAGRDAPDDAALDDRTGEFRGRGFGPTASSRANITAGNAPPIHASSTGPRRRGPVDYRTCRFAITARVRCRRSALFWGTPARPWHAALIQRFAELQSFIRRLSEVSGVDTFVAFT
jgi:hypothetical protein